MVRATCPRKPKASTNTQEHHTFTEINFVYVKGRVIGCHTSG